MPALRIRLLLAAALGATALAAPAAAAAAAPESPAAPGDLRVTAVTPTSVTLSWTASAPGCCAVEAYTVGYHRAFNDVYWSQPAGDVTTVTITSSIQPTGQYTFSVSARDVEGHSSPSSNTVTVVTPAGTTGDTAPPSAPGGLRVTSTSPAGVGLAWQPSADDTAVTGYDVFFFDGWFSSTRVGTTAGTTFVAPLMNSTIGRPAYYVRARDAAGNLSIASDLASVSATPTPPPTTPPPPTCRVGYRTTSEWRGGFVAEVTVTNLGPAPVENWSLALTLGGDQRVTSAWNATVSQSGADVTLSAARWNRTIAREAGVTVGLLGRWSGSNAPPTAAALNGATCVIG